MILLLLLHVYITVYMYMQCTGVMLRQWDSMTVDSGTLRQCDSSYDSETLRQYDSMTVGH